MMRRSIDDILQPVTGDHIRIVNEHRPDVHADEEDEMEVFLYREEVGEDVVGERLEVPVEWVKSVRGEGGGDDPLVVWFVDVFVDEWVVFQSVDPVNAVIGEDKEPNNQVSESEMNEEMKNTRTSGSRGRTTSNRVHQYHYTPLNTQEPLPQTTEASRASSKENSASSSRSLVVPGSSGTSGVSS